LIGCATVVGDRVVIEADHGRVPRPVHALGCDGTSVPINLFVPHILDDSGAKLSWKRNMVAPASGP
jgi:hypothetical protein